MYALKLTQIGNSYGWILPKEMLSKLKLEKGDCTYVTEAPDGMRITPYKSAAEEHLKLGRQFMHDFRDTFRELAK